MPTVEMIHRCSLVAALHDTDVAVARSHELAMQVVILRIELADHRAERVALRAELDASRQLHAEIRASRAYRLASKVWSLRRAVGG